MNPKDKVKPTLIAVISAIVILLTAISIASLNNQIPDQILPVNSSSELNLSAYFPEFQGNVF